MTRLNKLDTMKELTRLEQGLKKWHRDQKEKNVNGYGG